MEQKIHSNIDDRDISRHGIATNLFEYGNRSLAKAVAQLVNRH